MSHIKLYARGAAVGWAIVPIAWVITAGLDDRYEWSGLPVMVYQIGGLALIGAGVVTLLTLSRLGAGRTAVGKAAIVVGGIATLASVVSWALPLWMVPWAVAAALAGATLPAARRGMVVLSASMALGVVALVTISALEIGTPDQYGDYPVAGVSSFLIATIGAAIGMYQLSQVPERHTDGNVVTPQAEPAR